MRTRLKVGRYEFDAEGDTEFVNEQFHEAVERVKREYRTTALKAEALETDRIYGNVIMLRAALRKAEAELKQRRITV